MNNNVSTFGRQKEEKDNGTTKIYTLVFTDKDFKPEEMLVLKNLIEARLLNTLTIVNQYFETCSELKKWFIGEKYRVDKFTFDITHAVDRIALQTSAPSTDILPQTYDEQIFDTLLNTYTKFVADSKRAKLMELYNKGKLK